MGVWVLSKKFEKGLAFLFIPVVFIISDIFLHRLDKLLMTVQSDDFTSGTIACNQALLARSLAARFARHSNGELPRKLAVQGMWIHTGSSDVNRFYDKGAARLDDYSIFQNS